MTDIMIDIETLGLKPGCVVLSVGAVEFGPDGLGREFEANIDIASSMRFGLSVEADTLKWWIGQGLTELPNATTLRLAADTFLEWFRIISPARVWANSPWFDCEIWGHAMEAAGVARPWTYKQPRDMRTARDILPETDAGVIPEFGKSHTALADAKWQAAYLKTAGLFCV